MWSQMCICVVNNSPLLFREGGGGGSICYSIIHSVYNTVRVFNVIQRQYNTYNLVCGTIISNNAMSLCGYSVCDLSTEWSVPEVEPRLLGPA